MVHGWWLPSCKMTKTDDQEEGSIAEEKMRQVSEFFLCWSSNLCLHFLFWYFKIWRNSCEMMVVIHLHYNGQTFWKYQLSLLCTLLFKSSLSTFSESMIDKLLYHFLGTSYLIGTFLFLPSFTQWRIYILSCRIADLKATSYAVVNEIFIVSLFHVPRSLLIRSFIILKKFDPSGGLLKPFIIAFSGGWGEDQKHKCLLKAAPSFT